MDKGMITVQGKATQSLSYKFVSAAYIAQIHENTVSMFHVEGLCKKKEIHINAIEFKLWMQNNAPLSNVFLRGILILSLNITFIC